MKKIFFSLLLCMSTPVTAAEPVNLTILGTSDLHGTFVPWDYSTDIPNLAGSLSQIATQIHRYTDTQCAGAAAKQSFWLMPEIPSRAIS